MTNVIFSFSLFCALVSVSGTCSSFLFSFSSSSLTSLVSSQDSHWDCGLFSAFLVLRLSSSSPFDGSAPPAQPQSILLSQFFFHFPVHPGIASLAPQPL